MKEKGIDGKGIALVQNLNDGSTTRIYTRDGRSAEIDIRKGTKQGDPLSPYLISVCSF